MFSSIFSFVVITIFSASANYLDKEECLNYTIYPVEYDLTIYPHIENEDRSYYDCVLVVTVICTESNINVIELDARDFQINRESVRVTLNGGRNIIDTSRPFELDSRTGKLYLYLTENLEEYNTRKTKYYIHLVFRKILKSDDSGIFVVPYQDGDRRKYLITTRLSPRKAKYFYPCFENPKFEAGFKFKVYQTPSTDEHMTSLVISNEQRRNSVKDNYEIVEYAPSPQVATYQTGFHYSDFTSLKTSSHITNDTVILWAPDAQLPQYNYIMEYCQNILEGISKYSDSKRPIVNGPINLVAVPSSSMDTYEVGSWNLLTIGDHKLSYSPRYSSIEQKEGMSFLLSQQLSNIWLGNPGETAANRTRWHEEWLKEGMATYFGYYFMSHDGHSSFDMDAYILRLRHAAMAVDWHPDTPSLDSHGQTLAVELSARHRAFVGQKTASLLWMLENWVGSDKFHSVVKNYINSRRGRYISLADFATFLGQNTKECEAFKGPTSGDLLQYWTKTSGYPLVKVTVYRTEGSEDVVLLEQKQFSFNNESRSHHTYTIPITYMTSCKLDCYNAVEPKFTINGSGYTFTEKLQGGWIILNRNVSGYYRVTYDNETWKAIIAELKGPDRNKIDPVNRAQIMNDAIALYMSSEIDETLARELFSCLEFEEDARVWEAAISGFELLRTDGASVEMNKYLYEEWKELFRSVISPMYRRTSQSYSRSGESRALRQRIASAACRVKLEDCMQDSARVKIRENYDPDLRETCYYTLLNGPRGYDSVRITNSFEKEDLLLAERQSKQDERFIHKLPPGHPRPMPLRESTTTTTTTQPSTTVAVQKVRHDSGATSIEIFMSTLLLSLCVSLFY